MMAANYSQTPSSFGYQKNSPLETLVRRTSSRRAPPRNVDVPAANELNHGYTYPVQQDYVPNSRDHLATPPRPQQPPPQQRGRGHNLAPSSPLLHSHFSRSSVATASERDDASYIDFDAGNLSPQRDGFSAYGYTDRDSMYSTNTTSAPALRDSWSTARAHPDSYVAQKMGQPPASPDSPVPMVVISEPMYEFPDQQHSSVGVGKTAIVKPLTNNYSRPVRPLVSDEDMERRKLVVLQRNARNDSSSGSMRSPSPSSPQSGYRQDQYFSDRSTHRSPSPASMSRPPPERPEDVHLPRKPPSVRTGSPTSVYSDYSYYQYDSASPSPIGSQFAHTPSPRRNQFQNTQYLQPGAAASSRSLQNEQASSTDPSMVNDFLQQGITHHEANRLEEAAVCFEKSATMNGGCGVGMLMWGLSLRHGWGCKKDEKSGFAWLRKAAELAVADLEKGPVGSKEGVRGELVLAIYEVGQCFFQGWGVAKDQKMAVSYYTTAAKLGDPDAQNDLGFCLANGKGCKKDRKEAAKWYRMAVKQGVSDVGLAWIYKEKFQ
ncbi:hypothetical protein CYLTODRAFT_403340 [Cylindrobasidium torrendii FP15055 ss-10]|uniref:HCP-like protein n=1 Tax=Cylindrobasidium torrendii FP15055 ss-10 TaxID=1314674 RepID=A0A0D7AYS2_9AGAR|nr:hypothetical protein CYLTODRAFT_403340 [Cylindrobasidium torrendii FP15055 ss-10]